MEKDSWPHGPEELLCHSRTHHDCDLHAGMSGREQSWWGAKFWVCGFFLSLSPDTTVTHPWLSRLLSDTPAQGRELKPYKLIPICAFCDQAVLAPSKHPCVQVEPCQKL